MRAPACLRTALRRTVVPLAALAVCLTALPADAMTPRERIAHRGAGSASAFLDVVTTPPAVAGSADPARTPTAPRWVDRGARRGTIAAADRWTGYAFDACRAPSSAAMDRWRISSPFMGVGIYIGGSLRACPQRHLTRGWVGHQTRMGWRLLPIWVGPQASCTPYRSRISSRPGPGDGYPRARLQGDRAARGAAAAASRLGIGRGTTLWYDLEWFPAGNSRCRQASLHFLSAWTRGLHRAGYVAGVYSSVSAGIAAVGEQRGNSRYTAPDRVWFAWANGRRDVSWRKYLRAPRWRVNHRVHQYALDVSASYGGVRMAIDRNFVDLGGSPQVRRAPAVCGRDADRPIYAGLHRGDHGVRVRVAQCLLGALGHDRGEVGGAFGEQTYRAVRAFQHGRGLPATGRFDARTWTALLAAGSRPVLKRGSEGPAVRRLQRALTAALPGTVPVHGHFGPGTVAKVARFQATRGLRVSGVVTPGTWHALRTGAPVHHVRAKHGHGHGMAGKHGHGATKHAGVHGHGQHGHGHGHAKAGKHGHGHGPGKHGTHGKKHAGKKAAKKGGRHHRR
ncbi:MAG: glycoside hydrolase domain-containing protein [Nocardioides sp.]